MRVEIEEMLEGFMAVRLTEIQDNFQGHLILTEMALY